MFYCKLLSGVFFSYLSRMPCKECGHVTGDITHEHCRSHAFCSRGYKYFAAFCPICQDLWNRAKNTDLPDHAVTAFRALRKWIRGFHKNSKRRNPGEDYFYSQDEREAFDQLKTLHPRVESSESDASQVFQDEEVCMSSLFGSLWILIIFP